MNIKEGYYDKLGAVLGKENVTFTFEGEKEDVCAVVLVHKQTKEEIRVEVPKEYCIGSLRSIRITDWNYTDYVYYFEINGEKVIDPYARGIFGREIWNNTDREADAYEVFASFDEVKAFLGDAKPEIPKGQMFMYKLHVRGFTMDAPGMKHPGTFAALAKKIPYLKKLGITTVELMPVYEFEEMPLPSKLKLPEYINWESEEEDLIVPVLDTKKKSMNYWGYGPGNYFAVKASYASEPLQAKKEFVSMVKKFHESGMEVVMEMFFPAHTNQNLILDALRYWVKEIHVDGFHLLGESIPITAIAQDVLLSRTKIFFQHFPKELEEEERRYPNLYVYKDEYMYPARQLLNHFNGNMREFANQQRKQGKEVGYINYIASNNGFTLADLFMYNDRHNEDNGEDNQDGNAWNFSNNYGVEGPTRKQYIRFLRRLKWTNAVTMLCLAQGVPLLWAGDEMGNSQKGNNNAYCQDNPLGWLNWKSDKAQKDKVAFLEKLIAFRREHPILSNEKPFEFCDYKAYGCPDMSYHGEYAWLLEPDEGRMCIGFLYSGLYSPDADKTDDVYVAYNFFSAMAKLALPNLSRDREWYLVADTSRVEQVFLEDLCVVNESSVMMNPQSICIFVSKKVAADKGAKARRKTKADKTTTDKTTADIEVSEKEVSHESMGTS